MEIWRLTIIIDTNDGGCFYGFVGSKSETQTARNLAKHPLACGQISCWVGIALGAPLYLQMAVPAFINTN